MFIRPLCAIPRFISFSRPPPPLCCRRRLCRMSPSALAELRVSYGLGGDLEESRVPGAPLGLFLSWLGEAVSSGEREPNAMCLSTVSGTGQPSGRFVLLKGVDARGFVFYTNLRSRKARELDENPRAALTFWWGRSERSVRVEGVVERVEGELEDRYFNSRPWMSRLGAWASKQSEVVEDRRVLEKRVDELMKRFGRDEEEQEQKGDQVEKLVKPPFWGGYRVRPRRIEFWKGRESRLHDRIVYERVGEGFGKGMGEDSKGEWTLTRLQP